MAGNCHSAAIQSLQTKPIIQQFCCILFIHLNICPIFHPPIYHLRSFIQFSLILLNRGKYLNLSIGTSSSGSSYIHFITRHLTENLVLGFLVRFTFKAAQIMALYFLLSRDIYIGAYLFLMDKYMHIFREG